MSSNFYPPLPSPHSGGNPTASEQWGQQVQPYPAPQRPYRVRNPDGSEQSGQLLQLPPTPQIPHSGGNPASEQQGQLLQPPLTPQIAHGGGNPASEQQGQLLQPPLTPQIAHSGNPATSKQQRQWLGPAPKPPKQQEPPQDFSASKQPFVTSDHSNSPEPPEPTTHTKEQREAISRVLKYHEKNYYKILGLLRSCSTEEIQKSYRKLSLSIHPDRNNFSDASKAFTRIKTACSVLSNPKERQEFDRLQQHYQPKEDLFGEEFHDNAFGDDSDSGNSNEGDDFSADKALVPNEACMEIYERATPYIRNIQRNNFLDEKSKTALKYFNEIIGKYNESHGLTGERKYTFYIDYGVFSANMDFARPWAEKLKSDPNNGEALRWVKYYQDSITNFILLNGYPKSWVIARNEMGEEIENDIAMKSPTSQTAGVTSEADAIEVRSALQKYSFRPGFTSNGERILGGCPVYRTSWVDGTFMFSHGYFVVEKRGELNPIALVSSADLGRQAVLGYLDLPDEQKCDLRENRYVYNQRDTRAFRRVIGFASNPQESKEVKSGFRYPTGYALCLFEYDSGSQEILMNRGKLRKIMGERAADKEIARFYEITRITPPWEVEPRSFHDRQRPGVKQLPWNQPQQLPWKQPRLLTYRDPETENLESGSEYSESEYESEESEQDTGRRRLGGRNEVATLSEKVTNLTAMFEQLMQMGPGQQPQIQGSLSALGGDNRLGHRQDRGKDRGQGWGEDRGRDRRKDRGQGWGEDRGRDRRKDRGQGWGEDRRQDRRQGWGEDLRQDSGQGWGEDRRQNRGKDRRQNQEQGQVYDKPSRQRGGGKDQSLMMSGALRPTY
ncbi:hypothetical protein VE00_09458 [Pseudogymnoascus sp. WSF 3629]|nr:hypothetical protein VE00_09458 [Pseudogymnoascus sp. WSF 3629]